MAIISAWRTILAWQFPRFDVPSQHEGLSGIGPVLGTRPGITLGACSGGGRGRGYSRAGRGLCAAPSVPSRRGSTGAGPIQAAPAPTEGTARRPIWCSQSGHLACSRTRHTPCRKNCTKRVTAARTHRETHDHRQIMRQKRRRVPRRDLPPTAPPDAATESDSRSSWCHRKTAQHDSPQTHLKPQIAGGPSRRVWLRGSHSDTTPGC